MFYKYKDQQVDDVVFQVATFNDGTIAVKMPTQSNVLNYEAVDFASKFESVPQKDFTDYLVKFENRKSKPTDPSSKQSEPLSINEGDIPFNPAP
jgi:transposase-like protein